MPTTSEKITAIKENGYDIDFSRVFENAFHITNRSFVQDSHLR